MASSQNTGTTLKPTDLLARMEADAELAKTLLSRELHDEMGGYLVSAIMDVAWLDQQIAVTDDIKMRIGRIRQGLGAAIDLKRKMIEKLRPTLLDTFGLLAALRWHHKHLCDDAGFACTDDYPAEEPALDPSASIVIFRIVQEALAVVTREKSVKTAHLSLSLGKDELNIRVNHDGDVLQAADRTESDAVSFWLIEQRLAAMGGKVTITNPDAGGMHLHAEVPLARVLAQAAE